MSYRFFCRYIERKKREQCIKDTFIKDSCKMPILDTDIHYKHEHYNVLRMFCDRKNTRK